MPWMTIPIAMAMAGGASAGAQIYSTKRAGDTNRRTIDANAQAEQNALAYEREEAARKERQYKEEAAFRDRAYRETLAADQSRWNDYASIMAPHWGVGNQALMGLNDLMGTGMPSGGGGGMPSGTAAPPVGGGMPVSSIADPGSVGRTAAARRQPRRMQTQPINPGTDPIGAVQQLMSLSQMMNSGRAPMADVANQ